MRRMMVLPVLTVFVAAAVAQAQGQKGDAAFAGGLGAARQLMLAQQAGTVFSWQTRDVLLVKLQDPDAGVRKAALKSLRDYAGQSPYVWQTILAVLNNPKEEPAVRYEAVKTLSRVAKYPEVRETLGRYAADPATPAEFKGICYKALYGQAAGNPEVTAFLLKATALEQSKEAMLGAVWALSQASNYPAVAGRLMEIASKHPDLDIRVQAVRGLYRGMGRPEVFGAMLQTAANAGTPAQMRYPAILALSKVKTPAQQQVLQAISLADRDPAMREAASLAMNPRDARILTYFYVPMATGNGAFVDPLENE